jgi:hypothetical protein
LGAQSKSLRKVSMSFKCVDDNRSIAKHRPSNLPALDTAMIEMADDNEMDAIVIMTKRGRKKCILHREGELKPSGDSPQSGLYSEHKDSS